MEIEKKQILKNICYTDLVYERINKKLNTTHSKIEIEKLLFKIIEETDETFFQKTGKNFYISNSKNNIIITINSNTYRVITVNRFKK